MNVSLCCAVDVVVVVVVVALDVVVVAVVFVDQISMELIEHQYDRDNTERVVTICNANVLRYLSGMYDTLHICFLREQEHVPLMGLASHTFMDHSFIDFDELWSSYNPFVSLEKPLPQWTQEKLEEGDTIQFQLKFYEDTTYVRLAKNRREWDDLYIDYLLNGVPRKLHSCACCIENDKDRVAVTECGHSMCLDCWGKWTKGKIEPRCFLCHESGLYSVIAIARDSPCPLDYCRSGDGKDDYVLVPCGNPRYQSTLKSNTIKSAVERRGGESYQQPCSRWQASWQLTKPSTLFQGMNDKVLNTFGTKCIVLNASNSAASFG
ncbi:hypothetical protein KIN20_018100 [Parelaphostrongylus tenuis]|uniref:RING-type domain-containing protein n=1 Tax=Parelaphostrongylus tenuis TaxID=148309 RepID=A0AAD5N3W0_PARTN|nr:hypothetical protein KIN20_018100 [Parelaphostrongylus tenuis]